MLFDQLRDLLDQRVRARAFFTHRRRATHSRRESTCVVIDANRGGAFASLTSVPGPATGGGEQPEGWAATVFFSAFIPVLTILPFVFAGLTIHGLRASAETSPALQG